MQYFFHWLIVSQKLKSLVEIETGCDFSDGELKSLLLEILSVVESEGGILAIFVFYEDFGLNWR